MGNIEVAVKCNYCVNGDCSCMEQRYVHKTTCRAKNSYCGGQRCLFWK